MSSISSSGNVRVVCRFRPENGNEEIQIFGADEDGSGPFFRMSKSCVETFGPHSTSNSFNFDNVFDSTSTQADIFTECGMPLVNQCFEGYNSTLFCYGQTGSGKTYTMMGAHINDHNTRGLTPRLVEEVFNRIEHSMADLEFTVCCSYLEIYMEKVRDLLQPDNDNLSINEDPVRGVYVKGLEEIYVSNEKEVFDLILRGDSIRKVSSHKMNQQSSRSHSLFIIKLTKKDLSKGTTRSGKLSLVDLAGSEKVRKTGASGQTLEEAKKINTSLTTLGMVINALTDGKSSHIPYRDSKLTRILQESLGGNSKTTLIINCSPSNYNQAETISTLRFGQRAKSIKNSAKVNLELSPIQLKESLKKLENQYIALAKYVSPMVQELESWRAGNSVTKDEYVQFPPKKLLDKSFLADDSVFSPESITTPKKKVKNSSFDLRDAPSPVSKLQDINISSVESQDAREQINNLHNTITVLKRDIQHLKSKELKVLEEHTQLDRDYQALKLKHEDLLLEQKDSIASLDISYAREKQLESKLDEILNEYEELKSIHDKKEELDIEKKNRTLAMLQSLVDVENIKNDEIDEEETLVQNSDDSVDISSPSRSKKQISWESLGSDEMIHELESIKRRLFDAERKTSDYRQKCNNLENELKTIEGKESGFSVNELRKQLEKEYSQKLDNLESILTERSEHLDAKAVQIKGLQKKVKMLELKLDDSKIEENRQKLNRQVQAFESSKLSLVQNLQNRCEKIVELEISLDRYKEKYSNLLKSADLKNQQKKMSLLERNLDQLTKVQKQLVDQNINLKQSLEVSAKKISNRNERIYDLEKTFHEISEKLRSNQVEHEEETERLMERINQLEENASKNSELADNLENSSDLLFKRRTLTNSAGTGSVFETATSGISSLKLGHARVAKPLRGGAKSKH